MVDYTGLKEMYENGATIMECAKHFGVSRDMMRANLKKFGASMRPRGRVKIKQIKIDELKEMYENGTTLRECAKHFGVSHEKIRIELKRLEINLRNPGPTAGKIAEFKNKYMGLKEMYEKGSTVKECADFYKVSTNTIYVRLNEIGYTKKTSIDLVKLKTMYEEGSTVSECAKHFGRSNTSIWKRLKRIGGGLRKRGTYIRKKKERV